MSEKKLAIDMTPEELNQWIDSLEIEDDSIPEFRFSNPDPYFKVMTTRLAGGMFSPYKGIIPACARKAH